MNASKRIWMLRTEHLFKSYQGSLKERFGFSITTLGMIKTRQVVDASQRIWVLQTKYLFTSCQSSLQEWFGFSITALGKIKSC